MVYLKWDQKTITDFSENNIEDFYNNGFVFGRLGKGIMDQTRSIRIDLSRFELSSENRRILRKTESVEMKISPIPFGEYHWNIGKLGKDFYDNKFGEKTFSANKLKEIITDKKNSNFNLIFRFLLSGTNDPVGYCVSIETKNIVHYCYPFYDLKASIPNLGLGMMLKSIIWAKKAGKQFMYLGSAQRSTDTYKLQFEGIQWFDGLKWQSDVEKLKLILNEK